jgi:biotin operon repressor
MLLPLDIHGDEHYNFDVHLIISTIIKMTVPDLLPFFKALADATRLRLIGLLADDSHSVEQLAALLNLQASTISHHLSRLEKVGLVHAHADGYYSVYHLHAKQFETIIRGLLEPEAIARFAQGVDREAYNNQVLGTFMREDGSLREIPAQRKKRDVIFAAILKSFQHGKRYSEAQVNEILAHFHPDTATLRRELVGLGWMGRENSIYWRTDENAKPRDQSAGWSVW